MGNQLVGIAPSQIFPVDHYFSGQFGNDILYESNMGSTRFFKVVKAKSEEGFIVVKVFVKHDPTLPLEEYKKQIEGIKLKLENAVNCLPFQRVLLTDKAAYIMRQFVKHSLYDRVSTRPFLTALEKNWITFQILCALNQCHKQKICHGDIKLENILITSWNWIVLSDFASYKPIHLPEDNPADYTYFFDTSRRRTCYIAPERFIKSIPSEEADANMSLFPTGSIISIGSSNLENSLHPAMDIFSAGCALLELWTEGSAPFELSQLLAYRRGEQELVEKHLEGIEHINLRNLLASMIDLNPLNRKRAENYLDEERGHLFPEYFYSFLQSYLQMFSTDPLMSPDEKILRLTKDINHCIKELTNTSNVDNVSDHRNTLSIEKDGLILIITLVTSCIRGLKQSNTKIHALEILEKLSQYTTSETILDRILPYILHLSKATSSKVQVQAIETLSTCLSYVKNIQRSDANVFPEYILPLIAELATEQSSVLVRVAFARNIAKLAKIAIYFLEESQRNAVNEISTRRYEAELNALHEIIQQAVSSLLTDAKPIVKQSLMESGISDLCAFFGKEKASDIVLSHIITFLNDDNKNLRGSFYDNIAGVACYIGWQASDVLVPLLLQGLTDREEFVTAKAIRALSILIELGHINKPTVSDIIKETVCFICHPNLWIRHEVCEMISSAARSLSNIDVQCIIIPEILKFLKTDIIQIDKIEILMDCIHPPIPRQVFDSVLRFADIQNFITALEHRAELKKKKITSNTMYVNDMDQTLQNLFRRLNSEGLNDMVEVQLLCMKSFLLKSKHRSPQDSNVSCGNTGRIMISGNKIICHIYPLNEKSKSIQEKRVSSVDLTQSDLNVVGIAGTGPGMVVLPGPTIVSASTSLGEYTLPEKNVMNDHYSECRTELEVLKVKIKDRYNMLALSQRSHTQRQTSTCLNNWEFTGTMVAHLHEHAASVMKLTPVKPNGSLFASGSVDGTVRLWDCNKLNGGQGINKSRQVYSANTPINTLVACDGGQSLALGGKDGSLLIMRIDRNSSKMTLQQALHSGHIYKNDGPIVDMHSFEQTSHNLIAYATLYGAIVAWDARMKPFAWRLQNDLRHGVITTICADPTGSWLATGTSGGKHICYDLRFRLPIAEIKHPSDSWIRKINCHPTEPSCLISSSQSNNEVSFWNIETGHRQTVLWASSAPVFSNTIIHDQSTTCGLLTGIVNNSPFVITGSSDQRIRFWDTGVPPNSELLVPAARDNLLNTSFKYSSRLVDGSQVIIEHQISLNNITDTGVQRATIEETPRSGPEMPSSSHNDAITDLLMCKSEKGQMYIASASRDGVIKLWK